MDIKNKFDAICFNLMSGLKEEDQDIIKEINCGYYPWYEMEAFHRYGIDEFPKWWYDFLDKDANNEEDPELLNLMDSFAIAGYKLYNKLKTME